ncbi:phage tail assembly chaperone family protein, TAC [Psychrobacter sp. 2Y5]|uniref:phage tail assembly chaperone family protein, TAC n=1 Tax=unclassified Psychrobacter TaxID=196806 RepID=UPI003F462FD4
MAKTPKATQPAATQKPIEEKKAPKILLSDVKAGSLVSEIRDETVSFYHNGEEYEVDIRIKQLPFAVTDDLHKRMNNKEDVTFEWISKALVDDDGKQLFTQKQVEDNFVQAMGSAIFDKVWGIDNIKKAVEKQAAKNKKE